MQRLRFFNDIHRPYGQTLLTVALGDEYPETWQWDWKEKRCFRQYFRDEDKKIRFFWTWLQLDDFSQFGKAKEALDELSGLCGYLLWKKKPDPESPFLFQFDADSTFFRQEQIDEFAAMMGRSKQVEEITAQAMEGKMDFSQALKARLAIIKGLSKSQAEKLFQQLDYSSGILQMTERISAKNWRMGIASGGFSMIVDRVVEKFRMDYGLANDLAFNGDLFTGVWLGEAVTAESKRTCLSQKSKLYGAPMENTAALGDGANDIPAVTEANFGFAYRAKPALHKVANGVIVNPDISISLQLMGLL